MHLTILHVKNNADAAKTTTQSSGKPDCFAKTLNIIKNEPKIGGHAKGSKIVRIIAVSIQPGFINV